MTEESTEATETDGTETAVAETDATETLDAREVDGEPFGAISAALDDLDDDETLRLINSFEPQPLYAVLEDRGFIHETEQVADDEWHVHIRPE